MMDMMCMTCGPVRVEKGGARQVRSGLIGWKCGMGHWTFADKERVLTVVK